MSDAAGPRPAPTSPGTRTDEHFTVPIPTRHEQTQVLPVADLSGPPPVPLAPGRDAGSAAPDPLLAQIGTALFWMTVGWWLIVVVRLLGSLVRTGSSSTLLISNIDHWPEETIVAAVISLLAAVVLLLGRGSRGRDALGWSAGLLAIVTVAVAVWRLLP
ncbi:MAG: hypothetical protein JWP82_109 [Humibacillus sp.]|nr:hypothetical protein [Humibacillus sp.]